MVRRPGNHPADGLVGLCRISGAMSAPILMVRPTLHTHHAFAPYSASVYVKAYENMLDLEYVNPCLLESLDLDTPWRWGVYNPDTRMLQPFETYDAALVALTLGCAP